MIKYLTIFHNRKILPICTSQPVEDDRMSYMGEPTYCAGSLKVWTVDDLRVILSNNMLTSSP